MRGRWILIFHALANIGDELLNIGKLKLAFKRYPGSECTKDGFTGYHGCHKKYTPRKYNFYGGPYPLRNIFPPDVQKPPSKRQKLPLSFLRDHFLLRFPIFLIADEVGRRCEQRGNGGALCGGSSRILAGDLLNGLNVLSRAKEIELDVGEE